MRILFVLEHYYPSIGGVEKLFNSLAESLVKQGFDVQVITLRSEKDTPKEEILNEVKIKRLNLINRFFFTFFSLRPIIKLARNADIIHTTSYNAAFPAYFAAKRTGKKVIITFHEVWGKLWFKLPFVSLFSKCSFYLYEKLILRLKFDKFIAVSNSTEQRLIENGVDKDRITRLYNGIDYSQFSKTEKQPPDEFTYAFFGRLGISKGLDILIKAAKRFYLENPESRLKLIIPNKPAGIYRKVSKLINSCNLNGHIIKLHNLHPEVLEKELLNSNCVVIPSYSEGFCYAAAEAIAMGIPVISSHQGALKEVVSGKYIQMAEMNEKALYDALIKAKNGVWDESEVKYFKLSENISNHVELYKCLE